MLAYFSIWSPEFPVLAFLSPGLRPCSDSCPEPTSHAAACGALSLPETLFGCHLLSEASCPSGQELGSCWSSWTTPYRSHEILIPFPRLCRCESLADKDCVPSITQPRARHRKGAMPAGCRRGRTHVWPHQGPCGLCCLLLGGQSLSRPADECSKTRESDIE